MATPGQRVVIDFAGTRDECEAMAARHGGRIVEWTECGPGGGWPEAVVWFGSRSLVVNFMREYNDGDEI